MRSRVGLLRRLKFLTKAFELDLSGQDPMKPAKSPSPPKVSPSPQPEAAAKPRPPQPSPSPQPLAPVPKDWSPYAGKMSVPDPKYDIGIEEIHEEPRTPEEAVEPGFELDLSWDAPPKPPPPPDPRSLLRSRRPGLPGPTLTPAEEIRLVGEVENLLKEYHGDYKKATDKARQLAFEQGVHREYNWTPNPFWQAAVLELNMREWEATNKREWKGHTQ